MNYAIIDAANTVINVIIWDGKPSWQPPPNTTAARLTNGAGIGWSYVNGEFTPPLDEEPVG